MSGAETLLGVFLPLFAAVDAVGLLPVFSAWTEGMESSRRRQVIGQSIVAAGLVGLLFLAAGQSLLALLGVKVPDFTIGGGIVLLVYSLGEQFASRGKQDPRDPGSFGAVPLGVPLLVGPGVLTALVLLRSQYGFAWTALSLTLNLLLAAGLLMAAPAILRRLGKNGARVASQLSALLLTTISIMLIRRGVEMWLAARP